MVKVLAERRRGPGRTPAAPQSPHCAVGGFVARQREDLAAQGEVLRAPAWSSPGSLSEIQSICSRSSESEPVLFKKKKNFFETNFEPFLKSLLNLL